MGSKSRKYNFNSSVRLHKTHNILSKSLKIKLMFSYVMIALISISLIGSLTYINNKNIIKNKISGLSEKTTAQTKLSIDNYLNQIQNNIISMVFSQSDIIEYDPTDKNKSTYYQYSKQLEIEKELRSLSLIKSFKDCALIYENGTSIGQISKMNTDQDNIKKIYKQFSEELKGSANNEKWVSGYNNYYDRLYYIREINDNAILLTSILVEELNTIFEAVDDENMKLLLLNTEDNIIYSTNKDLIGTKIDSKISDNINGVETITLDYDNGLITMNAFENNWKIISEIPQYYMLKEIHSSGIITLIIASICIIISSIFGLVFSRNILVPIKKLVKKMREAENGDLTVLIDIKGEDEIATLSKSFNSMIKSIRNLLENTRNVSVIVTDEAKELKEMSKQTANTSEEICRFMEGISQGTLNQTNKLQITIETMDNLAQSINKIINNIANASTMVNETKNIGDESLNIVKSLDIKTRNTNEAMVEVVNNMDELTNSIKEIENVIGLIKLLSEQTNLLSLNASIEAARAGESGKGFAVVAEEVKKLAEQSKKSTESVNNVIKNVYEKASNTKKLMDNSRKVFNEQAESVKFTSKSFTNIIDATVTITNEIYNIETLIKEINSEKVETLEATMSMKSIIEASSENIQEVLAATEEQTAGSENLEECSSKLNNTILSLQENLNIFKTK